jgi:hypothetical protein
MTCRQVLLLILALVFQTGPSAAQGGIWGPANAVLPPLGSAVNSGQITPAPVIANTSPSPISSPQVQPLPLPQNDPNYDPFNPPRPASNLPPAPVVSSGPPKPPPSGLTGGTVCQNNVCSLSPVPVQPTTTATAVPVTPRYPPGYTGSTFGPLTSGPAPQGVNVGVAPTGQDADMSQTRAGVLRALGKP